MILEGKRVFGGIAIGKIAVYQKKVKQIKKYFVQDTEAEILRFTTAKERAKEQLQYLCEKASKEVGDNNARIFEVHGMMLDDLGYQRTVCSMITQQKVNAEYAVAAAGEKYAKMFEKMEDEYMKARGADMRDIGNHVISILKGLDSSGFMEEEPVILLADNLTPGEALQLDKTKVLSFVTRQGSANSHTAILARSMNIPAITGIDFTEEMNGKYAIADGYIGMLIVDPSPEVLAEYKARKEEEEKRKKLLQKLKGKESVTLDGKKINLYANIGNVQDVTNALSNDAEGIGLFRSEFLYLESEDYPTEEAQFVAYKKVAENMAGRKVIIRTLDIGADKQADYFQIEKEENPAMGYRAIRICLDRPEIFKTQLRAIHRAACYGNLSVMFPMIVSREEVYRIKEIVEEVKKELREEEIAYKDCEMGIMIETPAAVMISDLLAKEVDFFSVGTNDLAQYTLAIDRLNPKLDNLYDCRHEAILRMLQMVVDNGHKEGCMVGICGELAADTNLTETLLKMGFDELSVSPSMVLEVREAIRKVRIQ